MSFRSELQRWDDEHRPGAPTKRRTVLKALTVPLFAAAMTALVPAGVASAAPSGCSQSLRTCTCCSGKRCCAPNCYKRYSCGYEHCWYTCSGGCGYCCDWTQCDYYGNNCKGCICKGR